MENKMYNPQTEDLITQQVDAYMALYNSDFFKNESIYTEAEQLSTEDKEIIANAIERLQPKLLNEAYEQTFAKMDPPSIYGPEVVSALSDSVSTEATAIVKAETIAHTTPGIWADFQNMLQENELNQAKEFLIKNHNIDIDKDSTFKLLVHDTSVALNRPELYERLYGEPVQSHESISHEHGDEKKIVEAISRAYVESEHAIDNEHPSIEIE